MHVLERAVQRVGEPAPGFEDALDVAESVLVLFADHTLVRKTTRHGVAHGLLRREVYLRRVVGALAGMDVAFERAPSVQQMDRSGRARRFFCDTAPQLQIIAQPHASVLTTA